MISKVIWPKGKKFAFTIFDDTDNATIKDNNVKPVYDLLYDLGLLTTKTVWPTKGNEIPRIGGDTCENPEYLKWILDLKSKGFEISYHNNTFHTSNREQIIIGLNKFKNTFDDYPKSMANHAGCADAIYWGSKRFTGVTKKIYNLMTKYRYDNTFRGEIKGDPLFWGDHCLEKIKYVRNFTYRDINTIKKCPQMPYYDKNKKLVNYWFAASEGANVNLFNETLKEINQDRLEDEGGCCIMYSHLSSQFCVNGKLNQRFKELMTRLSKKDGWFVPTSEILDHLLNQKITEEPILKNELAKLERMWLFDRIYTKAISKISK